MITEKLLRSSSTLKDYRDTMKDCLRLYMPQVPDYEYDRAIDYSINKRYREYNASLINTYTNKQDNNLNLLKLADYINDRKPIVTAFGTMFQKHADCRNPMVEVVLGFLEQRGINKSKMFKFPKGSEMFEHFNLLQQLDKIDANGMNIAIA